MSAAEELAKYRAHIDEIDESLVRLLAQRFEVTTDIGQLKMSAGLDAVDEQRETERLARVAEVAKEAGLDPEFAQSLLRQIIAEVVKRHNEISDQAHGLFRD